jgi:hypothetical protein
LRGVWLITLATSTVAFEANGQSGLRPKKHSWELGGFGDALFLSSFHNLKSPASPHYTYRHPAVLLGARAAYFPTTYLGIELDSAFGFGMTGRRTSTLPDDYMGPDLIKPTRFFVGRAHVIGQLPSSRFVPFALLGAGALYANDTQMRQDTDLLFELGLGAKYYATRHIVPRLDLRGDATQRRGGGLADGVAFHGEVMLGVSGTFGQ